MEVEGMNKNMYKQTTIILFTVKHTFLFPGSYYKVLSVHYYIHILFV